MSASLIRSCALVTHAIDRHHWNEITDGAVLQEDGMIVERGKHEELLKSGGLYSELHALQFREQDAAEASPSLSGTSLTTG